MPFSMIPATYLTLLAAMSFTGWLVTASKTRAFWLGWRRVGRSAQWANPFFEGENAVQQAWGRFRTHRSYAGLYGGATVDEYRFAKRFTSRLCRYYAGIPVFKNRVFTLP